MSLQTFIIAFIITLNINFATTSYGATFISNYDEPELAKNLILSPQLLSDGNLLYQAQLKVAPNAQKQKFGLRFYYHAPFFLKINGHLIAQSTNWFGLATIKIPAELSLNKDALNVELLTGLRNGYRSDAPIEIEVGHFDQFANGQILSDSITTTVVIYLLFFFLFHLVLYSFFKKETYVKNLSLLTLSFLAYTYLIYRPSLFSFEWLDENVREIISVFSLSLTFKYTATLFWDLVPRLGRKRYLSYILTTIISFLSLHLVAEVSNAPWTFVKFLRYLSYGSMFALLIFIFNGIFQGVRSGIGISKFLGSLLVITIFTSVSTASFKGLQVNNALFITSYLIPITLFFSVIAIFISYKYSIKFKESEMLTEALSEANIKLEKEVEEKTIVLKNQIYESSLLLENMQQGVLTIKISEKANSYSFVIQSKYSLYLEELLGTKNIAGNTLEHLILDRSNVSKNDSSQIKSALMACIGEADFMFDVNSGVLPREIIYIRDNHELFFILDWQPLLDEDNNVASVMLLIRDITQEREAAQKAQESQTKNKILAEIIQAGIDASKAMLKSARSMLDELQSNSNKSDVDELFRLMHTIKGNARSFQFTEIIDIAHEAEEYYDQIRKEKSEPDRSKVDNDLALVQETVEAYENVIEEFFNKKQNKKSRQEKLFTYIAHCREKSQAFDPIKKNEFINNVSFLIESQSHKLIDDIIDDEVASLEEIALKLEKKEPLIKLEHNNLLIPPDKHQLIKDVMVHCLRNSMDHGIELPAEREEKGKSPQGYINVECHTLHDELTIKVSDDGRGLNLGALGKKATSGASDMDIANLLFQSGVSTAEKVSDISGRGVGMDAVRGFLQAQNGDINIEFTAERKGDFRPFSLNIKIKTLTLTERSIFA